MKQLSKVPVSYIKLSIYSEISNWHLFKKVKIIIKINK